MDSHKSAVRVTRLRLGVTQKPIRGAGSYAVTQLRGPYTCVRVHAGMRVCACMCVCATPRNCVTA